MNTQDIDNIFDGDIPLTIQSMAFLVNCKKKYLLWRRGEFLGMHNREGLEEYHIDRMAFDGTKKKKGLSAFGRLKNGAEFLEITIESHIPFCDEIILVDNNSTDNTREICQKMYDKYPDKIKIFQYKPQVYALGSEEYQSVPENSVHCMSYYYNRVLSQTSYSHCIKLDDDHLIIPERFAPIKQQSLVSQNTFFHTPLLNIIHNQNDYVVSAKAPFSGLYADFGIFPLSPKTYFVKDKKMENFLHPYKSTFCPTCFFHLKFLKTDKGAQNYVGTIKRDILQQITDTMFINISDTITKKFLSLYHMQSHE